MRFIQTLSLLFAMYHPKHKFHVDVRVLLLSQDILASWHAYDLPSHVQMVYFQWLEQQVLHHSANNDSIHGHRYPESIFHIPNIICVEFILKIWKDECWMDIGYDINILWVLDELKVIWKDVYFVSFFKAIFQNVFYIATNLNHFKMSTAKFSSWPQ